MPRARLIPCGSGAAARVRSAAAGLSGTITETSELDSASDGAGCSVRLIPAFLADLDIETLDFLVECRERHTETLGRLCLIPTALLQHVVDDPSLAVFENVEQGSIRPMLEHRHGCAAPGNLVGKQVDGDVGSSREHNRALDRVLKFAHVSRPGVVQQRAQALR